MVHLSGGMLHGGRPEVRGKRRSAPTGRIWDTAFSNPMVQATRAGVLSPRLLYTRRAACGRRDAANGGQSPPYVEMQPVQSSSEHTTPGTMPAMRTRTVARQLGVLDSS